MLFSMTQNYEKNIFKNVCSFKTKISFTLNKSSGIIIYTYNILIIIIYIIYIFTI